MPKKESKGWISVNDELPEEEGNYLVSMEDGDVCEAYFVEGIVGRFGHWLYESEYNRVTHWQTHPCNQEVF